MVVQKSSPEPKLLLVNPTDISEIMDHEKNKSEKFIVKFSMERCPPCAALQNWLDSGDFVPQKQVKVFQIKLGDSKQAKIAKDLREMLPHFTSVPYCIVADRNLTIIDDVLGFNPENFIKLCEDHIY